MTASLMRPRSRSLLSMPAIYPRPRARTLACLPLVCVAALLPIASGCGGSNDEQPVEAATDVKQPSDLLVTKGDIEKAKPDSPYGRLLGWWQAIQFRNVPAALPYYAGSARPSNLAAMLRELKALGQSRPILVESSENGKRVTLLTVIRSARGTKAGEGIAVHDAPATFRLVKEGGVWKLADNQVLIGRLQSQRALEAQQNQAQQNQG